MRESKLKTIAGVIIFIEIALLVFILASGDGLNSKIEPTPTPVLQNNPQF